MIKMIALVVAAYLLFCLVWMAAIALLGAVRAITERQRSRPLGR